MKGFHIVCTVVVFVGCLIPMDAAWALADITMGLMTLINLPACTVLSRTAILALKDYEKKRQEGKDPVFHAADIGLDPETLSCWK